MMIRLQNKVLHISWIGIWSFIVILSSEIIVLTFLFVKLVKTFALDITALEMIPRLQFS